MVALNVFAKESGLSNKSLTITDVIPFEQEGELVFRIFNLNPKGYVIISADENTEPVLGYGLSSNFDINNAPPALLFLLGEYKKEIKHIKDKKYKASDEINQKWDTYSSAEYVPLKSYSPGTHLLSTNWGQSGAYQQSCPDDPSSGNTCLVGCNAVALGQILNYWGCKVFPDGTNTYTPVGFTSSLTVNFYDQDYDWDNFDSYDIADLLYHCGVAIEMNYGESSSWIWHSDNYKVKDAMEDNFGFETSGLKPKTSYNDSEWINMLKADIDANRPIYYIGGDTTSATTLGHAWVVDGYNSINKFHCNWGWANGDNENSWYSLSDLNPKSYNFSYGIKAIFGAEPILDACTGLDGEDVVCSNNETYSVSIPTMANVVWSKSSSLQQVSSTNTENTYIVKAATASTSATGSVTATIKNSQNQTFLTLTKNVYVGEPNPSNFTVSCYDNYGNSVGYGTNFSLCDGERYTFHIDQLYGLFTSHHRYGIDEDNSGFIFDFDYDEVTGGFGWICIDVIDVSDDEYGFYEVTSECGGYDDDFKTLNFDEDNCGRQLLVLSPNPASAEVSIAIESDNNTDAGLKSTTTQPTFDQNEEWELEVYNNMQNLKAKKTKIRGISTILNTQSWNEGVYTVRAKYKGEVLTGKLVVKK